jgi:hypothetical protein
MNSRLLVIASSLLLVVLVWLGLFSAGVPRVYCPMPALTVLPIFILSAWRLKSYAILLLPFLLPPVLFIVWSPNLLTHKHSILPKRTVVLAAVLSVLTVLYFTFSWKYGVEYQGQEHTIIVCFINAIWLAMLWWIIFRALHQPSFRATLLSHWLLFAWLSWYAFPYLGEMS